MLVNEKVYQSFLRKLQFSKLYILHIDKAHSSEEYIDRAFIFIQTKNVIILSIDGFHKKTCIQYLLQKCRNRRMLVVVSSSSLLDKNLNVFVQYYIKNDKLSIVLPELPQSIFELAYAEVKDNFFTIKSTKESYNIFSKIDISTYAKKYYDLDLLL